MGRRLLVALQVATHPIMLGTGLLTYAGWESTRRWVPALAWALLAAAVPVLLPALLARAARRRAPHGRIAAAQRVRFLAVSASATCVWLAALWLAGAPRGVVAVVAAMLAALASQAAANRWWRASNHVGVVSPGVPILWHYAGRAGLLLAVALVIAVALQRLVRRKHTPAEVAGAAVLGALSGGAVFWMVD